MTVSAILRAAPIATFEEFSQPDTVRHHEMYDRGALKPLPGRELSEIPVLVDHIKDATPIGRVTGIRTDDCWTGGTWLWVHVEITNPPTWLGKGSGVSIGRSAYSTRTPWGAGWDLIQKAILTEVSILSPGVKPAHPRARVEWIGKPESPATGRTDRRPPAGGVVIHSPRVIRRAARKPLFSDEGIRERLARAEDSGVPGAVEREIGYMKWVEAASR